MPVSQCSTDVRQRRRGAVGVAKEVVAFARRLSGRESTTRFRICIVEGYNP